MSVVYLAVTAVTVTINLAIAAADLARARVVLATSARVGVPEPWLPRLAALKAAGAVGLLTGVLGWRPLGVAAGIGLVLFYLCAVGTHVRARVFSNIAFPAAFLAFAIASLVLVLTG